MKILYKGKLKTIEEIYMELKRQKNRPRYYNTIKELHELEKDE